MKTTGVSSFIAMVLAWLAVATALAEVRYAVTDLGDLGEHYADAYSVNSHGQVAGESSLVGTQLKPFFWDAANPMIDLVPPGQPGTFPTGSAYALNDEGQVAGYASLDNHAPPQAIVWSAMFGLQEIGTLGGADSRARGINNAGQVTGYAAIPNGLAHAFIWDASNGMRDISTIGGNSWGMGINDAGQIGGWVALGSQAQAFRWSDQTGMVLLGTLGGVFSQGYGINNLGHVVGLSATAEGNGNLRAHAFLYDDSGMHDLGTLGGNDSQAQGINDEGWVVGNSYWEGSVTPVHGFVYDGIAMRDLNDLIDPASGWLILDAHDINNHGQIAALASRAGEPWGHAVLLTPIPEPLACGVALLALPLLKRSRSVRTLIA